MLSDLTFIADC